LLIGVSAPQQMVAMRLPGQSFAPQQLRCWRLWGGWRHGLAGGRALQGPIHLCHPERCLASAPLVQGDDVLREKARVQAFGRDLEAAGVVA
jgi:hypothetical protein